MAEPRPDPTEASLRSRIPELEQALEHRRELVGAIIEGSYDGLCIFDAEGRLLEMNGAFERMTGISRKLLGRTLEDLSVDPKLQGHLSRRSVVLQVMEGTWPATSLINVKGGEMLLVTGNPQLGPDGKVRHIILNLRNITQLNYLKYQLERGRGETKLQDIERMRIGNLQSRMRAAGLEELVVASPIMNELLSTVAQIADFESNVLLTGETGVGKGIVAKALHQLSRRAGKPFVEVNCSAIPENLVESELFGYEAGAFTGSARVGKKGRIELAAGGTILLDEIGDLPLPLQVKLLKFLDDKVVTRLGGTRAQRIDVRVLAATNRNLRELVDARAFRRDLLYRLEVIPLHIPPLRERPEDLKALIYKLLEHFNEEFRENRALSSEALHLLLHYSFPGNVRELRNIIARMVLNAKQPEIGLHDVPAEVREEVGFPPPRPPYGELEGEPAPTSLVKPGERFDLREHLERVEREVLATQARWCRSTYELAERVGMHQSSIVRKLHRYGIRLSAR